MIRVMPWCIVFIFLCCGCSEFNPVTRKQEVILYSPQREIQIGSAIAREVEKEYELLKNPRVTERINQIVARLAPVVDRRDITFFVRVIQAKEEEREVGAHINAFALPGGYIYLYDGLIEFADNDDQIAVVIAHEMGHIVAKHSIKRLQAQYGYMLLTLASVGAGDPDLARGANAAFISAMVAYSQEDEFLADELGIRYAQEAGYDPMAMVVFLEKLKEEKRKQPLRAKLIFRTHPYFSERAAMIKKHLGQPLSITDYVNIGNE